MITLTPKRQLGVRVRSDVADELKRIAAAREMSVNELTEQIIVGHLAAIARGETMNLDEFTVRVQELVAEHTARTSATAKEMLDKVVSRVIRNIDALKAMIDSHVRTCHPKLYDDYVKHVQDIMRQMGLIAPKPPLQ